MGPSTTDHKFQMIQMKCLTSKVTVSETTFSKFRTHKDAYMHILRANE